MHTSVIKHGLLSRCIPKALVPSRTCQEPHIVLHMGCIGYSVSYLLCLQEGRIQSLRMKGCS